MLQNRTYAQIGALSVDVNSNEYRCFSDGCWNLRFAEVSQRLCCFSFAYCPAVSVR